MKQGEIWLVNLDPAIGAEIQKTRPALIISNEALGKLPLKIIVPITAWKEHFLNCPWMVRLEPDEHNSLDKTSSVDCFQIRSVSVTRLVRNLGFVESRIITEVQKAVCKVIRNDRTL